MIHCVCLGGSPAWNWGHGEIAVCPQASPQAVAEAVEEILDRAAASPDDPSAVCIWHVELGPPPIEVLETALVGPADAWHAGLLLGQAGRPGMLDFVHPTWLFQRDADPHIESSSWRLSFLAVLFRSRLWSRLGGIDPGFETLEGAALEAGHRWLWGGAILRHRPELLGNQSGTRIPSGDPPTMADELRFLRRRTGAKWTAWAVARSISTGDASIRALARAWISQRGVEATGSQGHITRPGHDDAVAEVTGAARPRVTVLIPTLDRYPYLLVLLDQLMEQSVSPYEVLVIDQTSLARRDRGWHSRFPALPLKVVELEVAGQCTSRNAGLNAASGDVVLFLDDDDEVEPDLIEKHLASLRAFRADAICGVADEAGAGEVPPEFRHQRMADVFPTNNGLASMRRLEQVGQFDLRYDTGSRADGDLSMRMYLSGALMVLDPDISVFHHHAPAGGLRSHGARKVTYAASRRKIFTRHLPSVTESYYARRYFTDRQVREAEVLRCFGTFASQRGWAARWLKRLFAFLMLPDTWWRIRRSAQAGAKWAQAGPRLVEPRESAPDES